MIFTTSENFMFSTSEKVEEESKFEKKKLGWLPNFPPSTWAIASDWRAKQHYKPLSWVQIREGNIASLASV